MNILKTILAIIIFFSLGTLVDKVYALDIKVEGNNVYLDGSIDKGTFKTVAPQIRRGQTIYLSSPGGYSFEAYKLALLIRNYKLTTVIAEGNDCSSACGLLFFAGKKQVWDGRLGVHCARYANEKVCNESATNSFLNKLKEFTSPNEFDIYKKYTNKMKMTYLVIK